MVKNPSTNGGDTEDGFNPWVALLLERGRGNPLQYSGLGNPMEAA